MCAVRKWVYVIGSIMCVVKEDKICGVCVGLCHSVSCWCIVGVGIVSVVSSIMTV